MAWDYDKKAFLAQAKKDPVWHLERLINYGLGNKKIDKKLLKKYLGKLNIPPNRRAFLKLILK